MIKLGSTTPTNFMLGSTQVQKIYLGSTLVWQKDTELSRIFAIALDNGYYVEKSDCYLTYTVGTTTQNFSSTNTNEYTYGSSDLQAWGMSLKYMQSSGYSARVYKKQSSKGGTLTFTFKTISSIDADTKKMVIGSTLQTVTSSSWMQDTSGNWICNSGEVTSLSGNVICIVS